MKKEREKDRGEEREREQRGRERERTKETGRKAGPGKEGEGQRSGLRCHACYDSLNPKP